MTNSRDMPPIREIIGGPLVEILGWLFRIVMRMIVGVAIVYGAIWLWDSERPLPSYLRCWS